MYIWEQYNMFILTLEVSCHNCGNLRWFAPVQFRIF